MTIYLDKGLLEQGIKLHEFLYSQGKELGIYDEEKASFMVANGFVTVNYVQVVNPDLLISELTMPMVDKGVYCFTIDIAFYDGKRRPVLYRKFHFE